jgi:hypothetical protein
MIIQKLKYKIILYCIPICDLEMIVVLCTQQPQRLDKESGPKSIQLDENETTSCLHMSFKQQRYNDVCQRLDTYIEVRQRLVIITYGHTSLYLAVMPLYVNVSSRCASLMCCFLPSL